MDVTLSFDDFRLDGGLNFLVVCNGLLADSGADAAHRDRGLRADLLQVRPPGEAGSAGLFRVLILIFLLI